MVSGKAGGVTFVCTAGDVEVTLFDWDAVSKNDKIGSCRISAAKIGAYNQLYVQSFWEKECAAYASEFIYLRYMLSTHDPTRIETQYACAHRNSWVHGCRLV